MIALNFEAALRVSYTSNILTLKKQLFTSEIQEAKYEAMQAHIREKDLELLSCNKSLSSLQQENSKLILEHEQNRRVTESLLQNLQKENATLRVNLNDAALSAADKDYIIEELKTNLNNISSQNEALDRQVKHASQKIEKTEHLEHKLAKISIMLQNEYILLLTNTRPLNVQKQNVEIRSLESKSESMAINFASLNRDYHLVSKQLEYV